MNRNKRQEKEMRLSYKEIKRGIKEGRKEGRKEERNGCDYF